MDHTRFESRKADHIRLALEERMQATGGSGLDQIRLLHDALPELDFSELSLAVTVFKAPLASPLFVSSMTAGHAGSLHLNLILARVAERRGWAMGVGSQRRQLSDRGADNEWREIRRTCPRARFFGNIGLAQVIDADVSEIRRLADSLEAEAMIVHLNPLQECLQPEGTPHFKGGLKALERLVSSLGLPVIVKETGCGFSDRTLQRLAGLGIAAVDVSGFGGTHWGRIEGGRAGEHVLKATAETFRDWGVGTAEALDHALNLRPDYEVWASGGIRTGLDAAKCLAMGARLVGLAKPLIEAVVVGGMTGGVVSQEQGEEMLDRRMETLEYELKTALFCTGSRTIADLREKRVWQWARKS